MLHDTADTRAHQSAPPTTWPRMPHPLAQLAGVLRSAVFSAVWPRPWPPSHTPCHTTTHAAPAPSPNSTAPPPATPISAPLLLCTTAPLHHCTTTPKHLPHALSITHTHTPRPAPTPTPYPTPCPTPAPTPTPTPLPLSFPLPACLLSSSLLPTASAYVSAVSAALNFNLDPTPMLVVLALFPSRSRGSTRLFAFSALLMLPDLVLAAPKKGKRKRGEGFFGVRRWCACWCVPLLEWCAWGGVG